MGRSDARRKSWFQLVCQRHDNFRYLFKLFRLTFKPQRNHTSGYRSSVALPLGINGGREARGGQWSGVTLIRSSTLFLFDFTVGRPGGTATLDAQAACCGPPVGRRPARATLKGRKSFVHSPTRRYSGALAEAGDSLRNRAIRSQFRRVEAYGAHGNVSCGPPRSEASARATLRVAKAQPQSKPHTQPSAAQSSPHFSALCVPHCGSAFAPPLFRAPARFNYFGSLPK